MGTLFKFVFFVLIVLVVLAFVGVEPLATYKDVVITVVSRSVKGDESPGPEPGSIVGPKLGEPYKPVSQGEKPIITIVVQRRDDNVEVLVQLDFTGSSRYGAYSVTLSSKVEKLGPIKVERELRTQVVDWKVQGEPTKTVCYTIVPGTQAYRYLHDGESPLNVLRVATSFSPQIILTKTRELVDLETEVLVALNRKRKSDGLPSLTRNPGTESTAGEMSNRMAELHTALGSESDVNLILSVITREQVAIRILNALVGTKHGRAIFDTMSEASISISTIDGKEFFVVLLLLPNLDSIELGTHFLINKVREQEGVSWVRWDTDMYTYAKSQSSICAQKGRLVHSYRDALHGGENLWMTSSHSCSNLSGDVVAAWLESSGHRAWLLSGEVDKAAIGVSESEYGIFVAWSFSE